MNCYDRSSACFSAVLKHLHFADVWDGLPLGIKMCFEHRGVLYKGGGTGYLPFSLCCSVVQAVQAFFCVFKHFLAFKYFSSPSLNPGLVATSDLEIQNLSFAIFLLFFHLSCRFSSSQLYSWLREDGAGCASCRAWPGSQGDGQQGAPLYAPPSPACLHKLGRGGGTQQKVHTDIFLHTITLRAAQFGTQLISIARWWPRHHVEPLKALLQSSVHVPVFVINQLGSFIK